MEDGKSGYDPSPVNPLPAVVWVLFGVIFAIEAVLAGADAGFYGGPGAVGWRIETIEAWGFSPELYRWMWRTGQWPPSELLRFVTYPFLHVGFVQMALVAVFVLAMGKMVGETMGNFAVAAIFLGSSAFGAWVYAATLQDPAWLIGGFPGAYGLIGGFTFVLWARAKLTGGNQAQAFSLIAMLMGVQLLFGLLFGTDNTWLADLAGFCAGFALCFALVPAARRALLQRMRRP